MRKFNALEEETLVTLIFSNFLKTGAAYLVKHKTENKEYIAKKILLGSL